MLAFHRLTRSHPSVKVATILVVILYIFLFTHWSGLRIQHDPSSPSLAHANTTSSYPPQLLPFWRTFTRAIRDARPDCPKIENKREIPQEGLEFDPDNHDWTRHDELEIEDVVLDEMKKSHATMAQEVVRLAPELHYEKGSRGIVTTAGGMYIPVLIISLRMLRRTGSTLPVEVFLASRDEYDFENCDRILPSLNAKCRILSDIYPAGAIDKIEKYQFKIFAMLLSTFEDVLFLDADNFPVRAPDALFDTQPYKSHGLVTWPDFWFQTSSRHFYDIAAQPVPPVTARQSTESGQLLLSKKTHAAPLLLATYYNYYGPGYYYPLLSQGAPGEGDKETFLAAAAALNASFAAVASPVTVLGHQTEDGFSGVAMVQYDPRDDWELRQRGTFDYKAVPNQARPLFIHHNYPKLDPKGIIDVPMVTHGKSGGANRVWGPKEGVAKQFGEGDLEKAVWDAVVETGCEMDLKTCDKLRTYVEEVFGKG